MKPTSLGPLLLAIGLSGCLPVVQHGPWVRPGVSGGPLLGAVLTHESRDNHLNATADGSVRMGVPLNDSSYGGFSFGGQISLLAVIAGVSSGHVQDLPQLGAADVYFAAPLTQKLAAGGGVQLSQAHVMPYVQLGKRRPVDGWYTTQALLMSEESDLFLWLPSVTYYDAGRPSNGVHYTITFGLGSQDSFAKAIAMFTIGMEFFRAQRTRR